ncbi:PilZ domain-containing protein [Stratiformator vulcanicus]|uniref:PilZ domain-containing protein n=1 Tax=Stratiformator vulcanicus TaxID=2527980 RepID=A0A517R0L3_9PLAN|nr:PilZ domain-containing protein [Stratiformator vulcanicus]QDT37429.1 hypothetical protein Pan189_18090 [Stratiformator vulcanicus]
MSEEPVCDWSTAPVMLAQDDRSENEQEQTQLDGDSFSSERRQFPRHGSGCMVAVCRIPPKSDDFRRQWAFRDQRLRGSLVDLSLGAAALLLEEPLEPEESVLVRIIHPIRDAHVDRPADVLRCISVSDRLFKIVCNFREKLDLEQVRTFGFAIEGDAGDITI